MFKAVVEITLKPGIVDPPGNAVKNSLQTLGFSEVESVRVGKRIEIKLDMADRAEAEKQVQMICDKLLANPVMEEYSFHVEEEA